MATERKKNHQTKLSQHSYEMYWGNQVSQLEFPLESLFISLAQLPWLNFHGPTPSFQGWFLFLSSFDVLPPYHRVKRDSSSPDQRTWRTFNTSILIVMLDFSETSNSTGQCTNTIDIKSHPSTTLLQLLWDLPQVSFCYLITF